MNPSPPLLRRLIPWVLGGTLVVLAVLALVRILWLRDQLWTQVRRGAEERLTEQVRTWEDQLLDRMDTWLQSAGDRSDSAAMVQEQLREQSGMVESIYLWRPALPTSRDGLTPSKPAELLFPRRVQAADRLFIAEHPCMKRGQALQYATGALPEEIADAYLLDCRDAPPAVRLEASIEAAAALERSGNATAALNALDVDGLDPALTLAEGLALSIPPDRLIVHRNRRAELEMLRGEELRALNLYYETGQQIAALDAPNAADLETMRWVLLQELESHNQSILHRRLEAAFEALDRRLRAWREITTQILPDDTAQSSENRIVRDQYADDRPYLLYYGVVEDEAGKPIAVALQLDQWRLLNEFLKTPSADHSELAITQANGRFLMGRRVPGEAPAIQVPFGRTLDHLRVGLYRDTLEARAGDLSEQWIIPLIITTFLLVIGFFALSSQIAAQRRLRELLARQREFTTRVTHELKTPIAGIKVMAENLEVGAFRGDDGRREMARRIVSEADRLTSRIDQVLATTQERAPPEPETFEVEELVFELIDVWGPRMEQHGVQIEADVDIAPEVHGDPQAVRDAIGCLLDNALKYRDPAKAEQRVWISLAQEGRFAVIEVVDNGLGVPAAQRSRIFDRFVRVEGPHRGLAGGHGLGLAQVAETARAHGGSVTCTDGRDGGVRFTLKLRGVKT